MKSVPSIKSWKIPDTDDECVQCSLYLQCRDADVIGACSKFVPVVKVRLRNSDLVGCLVFVLGVFGFIGAVLFAVWY